jgi:hypothetical protein
MKKLFLLSILPLLMSSTVSGQDLKNNLKINILSPVVRTFNLQYERIIKKDQSLQLGVFYTGYSASGTSFSGFGITPEFRYYLTSPEAPKGAYLAPFIRYQHFDIDDEGIDKGTLNVFGGGAVFGYQWLFKKKITLDMFLGPVYNSGKVTVTAGTDNFDIGPFDGYSIRTGICFGFAF